MKPSTTAIVMNTGFLVLSMAKAGIGNRKRNTSTLMITGLRPTRSVIQPENTVKMQDAKAPMSRTFGMNLGFIPNHVTR